ncbi:MAG TPA: DUF58 domain-containing protein [Propionibacteriaceae bacterium]
MVLTRRAGILAAVSVLAVAVAGSWWAVLVATLVVAGVIGADVFLAASPTKVHARRSGDTSVRLGQIATTQLMLTNTGTKPVRGVVRDAWTPSAGARHGVNPVTIPARQRRALTTTLLPTRRGDRRAGPVVVRILGPMRIAGRQAELEAPWTVRALPPFNSRKHLPSRLARLRELDGRSTILQRGQGTEFDSLREYVPGDDVRSIDWRGTARSTTVVVKTWRPERDRHVLIVLDSGRTSAGRVGDQPKLDHSMDAALLLAALASRAGDRVDLLIADRDVRASVLRKSAAEILPSFVNAMALIEPVLVETDHRELVTEITQRISQRSLIVFLTALDPAAVTEGLVPVLGPLRRRHKIVIAAVSDPRVDELLAGREDVAEVYAAAAAESDRGRRAETARTLRELGLSVVQAPPERFAPDLADHYLALKKAGQL